MTSTLQVQWNLAFIHSLPSASVAFDLAHPSYLFLLVISFGHQSCKLNLYAEYIVSQQHKHIITSMYLFLIVEDITVKFAVRSLSRVHLFTTPWTAARQASPSFTISRSLLTLTAIELVMPSNCLIPCRPLSSCLQSLLAASSFPVSRLSFSNSEVTNQ